MLLLIMIAVAAISLGSLFTTATSDPGVYLRSTDPGEPVHRCSGTFRNCRSCCSFLNAASLLGVGEQLSLMRQTDGTTWTSGDTRKVLWTEN